MSNHDPAPLKPLEFARWTWRQLTSMRTALLLLFLLALGAVPGSVIPQTGVDSLKVSQWRDQHPTLTPIYDRLGLFDVYGSPWFAAIYLLLALSLVGCILPRCRVYWRAARAQPPTPPARLERLPEHRVVEGASLDRAAAELRRRRYRVRRTEDWVAAERGFLREAGNLLFHVSVLIVLAGVAMGSLFGYQGGVIVVAKEGFANALNQYDDFRPGGLFSPDDLAPLSFTVDDFDVTFIREGREAGMAHKFSAGLTYQAAPGAPEEKTRISVNHPLKVDGTDVYLISHGYAPHITVRDGSGQVAWSGPVVFLPEDSSFRSFGVVKVPDATMKDGSPEQLGLEGEFYPTYAFTDATGPFSAFPDATNPALSMLVWQGDLGLDGGTPQSVYTLDKKHLTQVKKADGKAFRLDLMEGQSKALPDGRGTVTFDGVSRYVKLQISSSPGDWVALTGTILALLGLLGSLFVRPRRFWVRRRPDGTLEVAGLDRSGNTDLAADIDALVEAMAGNEKENP